MLKHRRSFLQSTTLLLAGLKGWALPVSFGSKPEMADWHEAEEDAGGFNMCGYAAPPLPVVRIGYIGIGNRGMAAVKRMRHIEGVEILALCDVRADQLSAASTLPDQKPALYGDREDSWKALCERHDLDLIYICTPWSLHAQMAVYAMNQGKHVCVEVPAARTLEECRQLVQASEKNRRHCIMLENVCYGAQELLTLNMTQQGFFGEIIHGEGGYIHDLLDANFTKGRYWNFWKLKESIGRNGNLYPTHGLGPVAQMMNLNRGDRPAYLVSVSGADFSMSKKAAALARQDASFASYLDKAYRGNINLTIIKTVKGKTILLQYDESSPRPRSTFHFISGTKGTAQLVNESIQLSAGKDWANAEQFKSWQEAYQPAIIKKMGAAAAKMGGHGGMDFLMDWRNIDCLRNGLPVDQDVYDAALWSAIAPLSEASVARNGGSVAVPDFTTGRWKTNKPVDLSLQTGASTRIIMSNSQ